MFRLQKTDFYLARTLPLTACHLSPPLFCILGLHALIKPDTMLESHVWLETEGGF